MKKTQNHSFDYTATESKEKGLKNQRRKIAGGGFGGGGVGEIGQQKG